MALISVSTILATLSLFHISVAFLLLTSPNTIPDLSLVIVIGEAMGMPPVHSFERRSAPLAFLASVFLIFSASDLVAVSLPEESFQHYWGTQAPVRLLLFFCFSSYSFAFSTQSPISEGTHLQSTWGVELNNRIFFTWAFIEMLSWFWIFTKLREERREHNFKKAAKRTLEDNIN